MADGSLRPISEIEKGDMVLGRSDNSPLLTESTTAAEVKEIFRHPDSRLFRLYFDSDTSIGATSVHPFAVDGKGWITVEDLEIGDKIVTHAAGIALTLIAIEPLPGSHDVYNLEVEGEHTYFVGADGAWVHNKALETIDSVLPEFPSVTPKNPSTPQG